MSTTAFPELQQMLSEMDQALADELEKQQRFKRVKHRAINGILLTEENGQYTYQFTLVEPWELKDDARLILVNEANQKIRCDVVTANGIEITIVSDNPLPPDFLRQVDLCDDSTELLCRLREALKKADEGSAKLGSKSFGLPEGAIGYEPSTVRFGNITPHHNQLRAAKMALAGEVTYIIGPPGTGKTVTLAAIALEYLLAERTVLIAANTNIAVDNAVMKLCELCKKSQARDFLSQGKVIRYGAVEKEELKTSPDYEDVYLPKIAQKLGQEHDQQRRALEQVIAQIDINLSSLKQNLQQREQEFLTAQAEIDIPLKAVQQELVPLQQSENQRISKLYADKERHSRAREEVKRKLAEAGHLVAQYSVQIEVAQVKYSLEQQREKELLNQLVAARNMSRVMRLFKGVHLQQLETKFAEVSSNVREQKQKLVDLQHNLQHTQTAYDTFKQKELHVQMSLQEIEDQLAMPTVHQKRIAYLKEQEQAYQSRLSILKASHSQQVQANQQQQRVLEDQRTQHTQQLATINQKLRHIEKNIVENAIIIGITLSKTYMHQTIADRRFDVVILDEVSMASLPSVYVATSHADRAIVLIGDPQQLAPIANAETPLARKWLKNDLFARRGVSLDTAMQGRMHSMMLDVQSRMHPAISAVANRLVYQNRLKNAHNISQLQTIEPLPAFPLILCDTHDASPIAMHPPSGSSRKNYYHALCCLAIARQVLKTLSTQESISGPCIGIVTPYKAQARLLQSLIADAGLQKLLQAGTVHKFQGLEFGWSPS
ncbi:MAG TPA: AAA domain-containing protein [Ktedonobacteraceae bacterium]